MPPNLAARPIPTLSTSGSNSRTRVATRRILVPDGVEGVRLDVFLARFVPPVVTRAAIQRAVRSGRVRISQKHVVKPSTLLHRGQEVLVDDSAFAPPVPTAPSAVPPLKILHEDRDLLVIEKPAGVPVHAGVRPEPSLVDALLARYPALREVGEELRPSVLPISAAAKILRAGIVHRLDKDTSGVLLVARTHAMYEHLKRQFAERRVRKTYVALTHGRVPEDEGVVKLPLIRSRRNPLRRTIAKPGTGKEAETAFRVLERFREHTLLEVFPRTGRMHQIRVHLTHLGFPVTGDRLYGRKSRYRTPPGLRRQFLHARSITVTLPSGARRTYESPLPTELTGVLETLRATPPAPPVKPVRYRWRAPRGPRGTTPPASATG